MQSYCSSYCYSTLTFILFWQVNSNFLWPLSPLFFRAFAGWPLCLITWFPRCRAMLGTYFTEFMSHFSENRPFLTLLASVKFTNQTNDLILIWYNSSKASVYVCKKGKKTTLILVIVQIFQNKICLRGKLKFILLCFNKFDSTLK